MKTIIHFKNGEKVEIPGFYMFKDGNYNRFNEIDYEENGKKHKLTFWLENVLYIESIS